MGFHLFYITIFNCKKDMSPYDTGSFYHNLIAECLITSLSRIWPIYALTVGTTTVMLSLQTFICFITIDCDTSVRTKSCDRLSH